MNISEALCEGYRELLAEKSYCYITVHDICAKASVSRKAFYAYYKNKHDLLAALIFNDLVRPTLDVNKVFPVGQLKSGQLLMLEHSYNLIYRNKAMYTNLYKNMGKHQLIDLMVEVVHAYTQPLFREYALDEDEIEYGAYFIASAQAMIMTRWIEQDLPLTPTRMAKLWINWGFARLREHIL